MIKTWLEKALNRYLALDPEAKKRIALLQNKVVALELSGTPIKVQLLFTPTQIQLNWHDEVVLVPDITIRGTPLNLLHMSISSGKQRRRFFVDTICVEGNMELAQQVLAIFDELEIDWEEQIAQCVGDIPAYHAGRMLRGVKQFGQQLRGVLRDNVDEYVHEEINWFPPAEALQDFMRGVDELRMDVDRLAARVAALKEKMQS